jgi:small subunit ribosomal protein S16
MPVKMRLQRHGRAKAPFYHIVIADSRTPRDGRFIEKIGTYNPLTKPATIIIDRELAFDWLSKGAQPTDTVRAILRFKGVMYKKHLMRGVNKGAMTVEQADAKFADFVATKEAKVTSRAEATKAEKEANRIAVFGKPKEKKKIEEPVVEAEPEVTTVVEMEAGVDAELEAAGDAPAAE